MEFVKIIRITDSYGRAVIAIAPGDVVAVLNPAHPRIVAVHEVAHFRIVTDKVYGLMFYPPVNAVSAFAAMDAHFAPLVVAAEYPGEALLEGHYGAIEDAIRTAQPYGVDVSSGVEGSEKGKKNHTKLELFIQRAKSAFYKYG